MRIFLGLGTNLGEREKNLVTARDLLMKHDVLVMGQSEVRETKPLGGLDQPMYLNQVIECQTELSVEDLLMACKAVEKEMGRPVAEVQIGNVSFGSAEAAKDGDWQSRIIDVDILFYGDQVIDSPMLKVPHPGILERDFVIAGLCDIAGDFVHPGMGKAMDSL